MSNAIDEINSCRRLFMADFEEAGHNSLRIRVAEGLPAGAPHSIEIAGVALHDCTDIEITGKSRVFEIEWRVYVGYSVRNESYVASGDEEQFEGQRFRVYSKSHFLDYMARATFASDDYPGPTRHYSVMCEDHVIDVLSVEPPSVKRLR